MSSKQISSKEEKIKTNRLSMKSVEHIIYIAKVLDLFHKTRRGKSKAHPGEVV
jgi:hypothetical protein